jgi:hypothetical protein
MGWVSARLGERSIMCELKGEETRRREVDTIRIISPSWLYCSQRKCASIYTRISLHIYVYAISYVYIYIYIYIYRRARTALHINFFILSKSEASIFFNIYVEAFLLFLFNTKTIQAIELLYILFKIY